MPRFHTHFSHGDLCFRVGDEILEECLLDVAKELEEISGDIATHVYSAEFRDARSGEPGVTAGVKASGSGSGSGVGSGSGSGAGPGGKFSGGGSGGRLGSGDRYRGASGEGSGSPERKSSDERYYRSSPETVDKSSQSP